MIETHGTAGHDRNTPSHQAGTGPRYGTGTFLCPVCVADLVHADGPCAHLLRARDRFGQVYCRDEAVCRQIEEAEREARSTGRSVVEALRRRLGPTVFVYDLLEHAPGLAKMEVVTFVIDLAEARS